jgi:UDP-N-acetylmuramoylalanine-D-glutamate ligase
MRILVCGGRTYNNVEEVYTTLDAIKNIELIISGHAKGADQMGEMYADERNIETEIYPAEWHLYGRAAGMFRNQQMLDEGKPDLVVAFPGGAGTAGMMRIAHKAGVEVMEIKS